MIIRSQKVAPFGTGGMYLSSAGTSGARAPCIVVSDAAALKAVRATWSTGGARVRHFTCEHRHRSRIG